MIRLNTSQGTDPPMRPKMTGGTPVRLEAGIKAIPQLPFPRMMEDLQDAPDKDEQIRSTSLA